MKSVAPGALLKMDLARARIAMLERSMSFFASGYGNHGASRVKSSLTAWMSTSKSPDEDIVQNLETLRERSRDQYAGAPLARGAIDRIVTSSVGPGLRPKFAIAREVLGMSDREADAWEDRAELEFCYWAESKDCDVTGVNDFFQLQRLALLSTLMNGDVFVALPMVPSEGRLYDLRVQMIEGDRVGTPGVTPRGKTISGGVEMGPDGRHEAYWIANRHPKSELDFKRLQWERVPVFGEKTGRRNILHLLCQERVDQARGVPLLSPVIEILKQLSRYTDAELMASVISGMYSVFFEHDIKESELGEEEFATGGTGYDEDYDDMSRVQLGYGTIVDLPPGVKATTASPQRPNQSFDAFVLSVCRQIGAALGIPYELLILHFTSSYSASRGALLEAWKLFRVWRDWLAKSFCQPILFEWLCEAVLRGRIQAPGFFDDPMTAYCYSLVDWYGPSQGQLDPLKEVNAAEKRIKINASSESREAQELTGTEWDMNVRFRAKEETVKAELGLAGTHDPDGADGSVREEEEM